MVRTTLGAGIVLALAAFISGCLSPSSDSGLVIPESGASRAYVGAKNIPSHGVALEGYCPVAYHAVGKPLRGTPEFASVHDDVTYYFVSADAKKAFDAEPEKFIPAYGGWCAFGMAVEDKFPVDPRRFKIVDGRLMLFLENPGVDALKLWNAEDEKLLVERADAHWRKVQG